ncbi:iron-sulfur cluster carrier protein ApbC [Legionella genomosp. 1]|uniref:iron-sulfur cluster carrier protein ApbC n=1 Tax=Legionella genomosp. 1 TaxID=1093625 RepID=UPI0010545B36|nr:iron-sulfur cluster carrier protein ApbC [Legionella genomosp. 1]
MNQVDQLLYQIASMQVPFLNKTIEELGLKYSIETDEILKIRFTAGFPVLGIKEALLDLLNKKARAASPGMAVEIDLQSKIQTHRTQMSGKGLRGVKNIIAVASGKGGVGKSTVTINLATALARAGARVGILDADIYGPSIPLMLGSSSPVKVENDHYLPVEVHGIQAMSIAYLTEDSDQALVWRGPMLAKALLQMLDITLWHELDYLFIDLPPGTGDIQLSLVQKIPLTGAVIVTTPQPVATLDAQKAIMMFEKTHIDVLGIIENMAWHNCSACGHQDAIFGTGGAKKLSEKYNVPLLGQWPLETAIRNHCDEGQPAALAKDAALADIFHKTALEFAIRLAQKPLNYADRFPDIVVE